MDRSNAILRDYATIIMYGIHDSGYSVGTRFPQEGNIRFNLPNPDPERTPTCFPRLVEGLAVRLCTFY